MDLTNIRELKSAARRALRGAQSDPQKLVLLHAGISALVLLAVAVLRFLIQSQVAHTGGLSGLGLRSALTTASSVLQVAANIALPFWAMGYTAAVLLFARQQSVGRDTLFAGFRSFGPVLRLVLLKQVIYFAIGMVLFQPAMGIFLATPFSQPLTQVLLPLMEQTTDPNVLLADPAVLAACQEAMLPMLVIFGLLYLLVLIPIAYRLRLADFVLMDTPEAGALRALLQSLRLTRRRCLQLLRLDVSYWWYFALSLLITLLAYGDAILVLLGIALPIGTDAAYFAFYAAHLLSQIALAYFAKNQVQTTYALLYDTLLDTPDAPPKAQQVPWNY